MSCNDGTRFESFVDVLAPTICRIVAEIRRKILTRGKQSVVAPRIYSEKDKEAMITWRSDLDRILRVFNVRSIVSVWLLLTVYSQTKIVRNSMLGGREGTDGQRQSVSDVETLSVTEQALTVA